ncbi:MAG: DUF2277 domain-containing protein [Anaerolineae bacterium]|nr:DUF2277 domain-containing protein [Anaerolineae bacterium]
MCRNIKKLRQPERPATPEECEAAALQFVRKVTGYQKPSKANEAAFSTAVADIAAITKNLLDTVQRKEMRD